MVEGTADREDVVLTRGTCRNNDCTGTPIAVDTNGADKGVIALDTHLPGELKSYRASKTGRVHARDVHACPLAA